MRRSKEKGAIAPRLDVSVTAAVIAGAVRCDPLDCMITQAIQDAYPRLRYIRTTMQDIRVTDPKTGMRYRYFTPVKAVEALLAFDAGEAVKPFSFVIDNATAIAARASGWKAGRAATQTRAKRAYRKTGKPNVFATAPIRKFGMCLHRRGVAGA